jgi:hypothetical protein
LPSIKHYKINDCVSVKDVLISIAGHLLWFIYRYPESNLTATTVGNDSIDL